MAIGMKRAGNGADPMAGGEAGGNRGGLFGEVRSMY